jgi:hypothetical protein
MARIVIVGDQNSGKTTFLALLYAAQVKSGSDASDDFRFHVTFESLDEISAAFQQLMAGSFPDSVTKEGIRGISFDLSYRSGILSRLRSRGWSPGASATLHLLLLRNLVEEMARLRKGSSLANASLRDILETDALAILVDSINLGLADEDRRLGPIGRYDSAVESLLSAMERSRAHGGRGRIHPMFVFSKFDSVDSRALRAAKVDGTPPDVRRAGPRTAYARALLDPNLPKTIAMVEARGPRRLQFAKPSYFFSWVRTEAGSAGGREKVRLRPSGAGGWEPDYSRDEYLAILECFRKIATYAKE